ncbi:MAG: TOBE domain-containing protein [Albidovulum sp.]|nr:TOBE domain-containing protein [Albidovulum sp.]MDE0303956.1 TOBE domain-containing protein [Albidovulum sp.]
MLDNGDDLTLQLPSDAAATPSTRIVYGLRPEHVKIGEPQSGLAAEVTLVEPSGFESRLHANIGAHVARIISSVRLEVVPGAQVTLVPSTGRVHLFDTQTGMRLS